MYICIYTYIYVAGGHGRPLSLLPHVANRRRKKRSGFGASLCRRIVTVTYTYIHIYIYIYIYIYIHTYRYNLIYIHVIIIIYIYIYTYIHTHMCLCRAWPQSLAAKPGYTCAQGCQHPRAPCSLGKCCAAVHTCEKHILGTLEVDFVES